MLLNFDAGPATLPREVLDQAAKAIMEYDNTGLSILEIPHRGALFQAILDEANALVRELLNVEQEYEVLWLQGGGRLQFSMVPMNFLAEGQTAGYIDSGHWAAEAIKAARLYGQTATVASSREERYKHIPQWAGIPPELAYLHLTGNNTIFGTQFRHFPETVVPLVADMSSELFSRVLDYDKFDLIYAVAQKNIGPAGVTLVVVKKALLDKGPVRELPEILDYQVLSRHNSVLNTPPVFAIYCSLLNLRWIRGQGIKELEARNGEKAALLYKTIDESPLFYGVADVASRSSMNVCFRAYSEEYTAAFLDFALKNGITGIKGHRSVGGFRASLYNAISLEHVQQLVNVIRKFEALAT